MATRTWNGADATTPNDWSVAGNWDEAAVPVSGDDVYFVTGSASVTAGLSQGAVALNSINFGVKWSGSITTALVIDATTVDYANKIGTVVLEGTYTTINVQATSIDSPALHFEDSTIANLQVTGGSGTVLVDENSTVTGDIDIIGAGSVKVEIEASATVSAADVTIDEGTFLTYEEVDTVTQFGGTVAFVNASGTTNTITVYRGTCKYKPTGAAVLTTLTMYGGLFDMRGCNAPSHTITNAEVFSGAMIDERNGLTNCVYTNPIVISGGIIKCDLGRDVTVT